MKTPRHAAGFTTIAAVFIVVVLAALGAFMLTFSNTQHLTSATDLQGSRAYRACQAGVQWMAGKLAVDHSACPAASATFTVDDFSVTATCALNTYNEGGAVSAGGADINVFWISSTATQGSSVGGMAYVERNCVAFMEFE
jgi:MSHA biogenesis protein MshP